MIVSSSGRLYDSALFWRHRSPVTFNPFLCCTLVLDFGGLFLCAILSSILSRDSFQNATILKAKTSYLRYRKVEKSYLNRIPFFRSGIMPAGHWMPKEKGLFFKGGFFIVFLLLLRKLQSRFTDKMTHTVWVECLMRSAMCVPPTVHLKLNCRREYNVARLSKQPEIRVAMKTSWAYMWGTMKGR